MIQKYAIPSAEQLKEFYLCGIRLAYTRKTDLVINLSNPLELKAYKCEYCPSWHKIPNFNSEQALLDEATVQFVKHMDNVLGNPSVNHETPTSAIIILSSN